MTDLEKVKAFLDGFEVEFKVCPATKRHGLEIQVKHTGAWVSYYDSWFEFDEDENFIRFVSSH